MVRYIGPRLRIIRRLGLLPGLTKKKIKNRAATPGEHGKITFTLNKTKRSSLADDYKERLREKQKLRFNYGITEKQLLSYYHEAKRRKGSTGTILLEILESRLDCVIFRMGFTATIPAARQLINHGHVIVNNKLVNIPSFLCKKGDIIKFKEKSKNLVFPYFESQQQKRILIKRRLTRLKKIKSRFYSLLPKHLEINNEKELIGKFLRVVRRKDVLLRINELKVVEYYSR
jgi:small subunit ribosomal protein S4